MIIKIQLVSDDETEVYAQKKAIDSFETAMENLAKLESFWEVEKGETQEQIEEKDLIDLQEHEQEV